MLEFHVRAAKRVACLCLILFVLVLVHNLSLQSLNSHEPHMVMATNDHHHTPLDYTTPSALYRIDIHDSFNSSWISAPLRMSIQEETGYDQYNESVFDIGFSFEFITSHGGFLTDDITGISIERIESYPYCYINSTKKYDWWEAGEPQYIMRRPEAFWSQDSGEYTGHGAFFASELNTSIRVGVYLFLHDIRVHFEGGSTVDTKPSNLLVWTEFIWNGQSWTHTCRVRSSMLNGSFLDTSDPILMAASFLPLHPAVFPTVFISFALVGILALSRVIARKRIEN